MANYIFESLTQAQAAGFTDADTLFFLNGSTTATTLKVMPTAGTTGGVSNASDFGTTLSDGTHTLNFNTEAVSGAAMMGHLVFGDSSQLLIGSNTSGDTLDSSSTSSTGGSALYGFGGNDTLVAGSSGKDYLYGGTGDDQITASTGGSHIYGNTGGSPTTLGTGVTDNDTITITATTGDSYVNGNQGNDTIVAGVNTTAGAAGSTGYNRIFGGNGDDMITVNGAQGSHAAVNGNMGMDMITDNGAGTNTLRGGQGADTITQGANATSHDVIMGDAGADHLIVGGGTGHVAVLTGGADADVFDFSTANAGAIAYLQSNGTYVAPTAGTTATGNVPTAAAGTTAYYQEVTDFQKGVDTVHLSSVPTSAQIGTSSTTFSSVHDAQVYAQTQLAAGDTISALNVTVGSTTDAYVFYHLTAGSTYADGVIHMDGVQASAITTSVFA